MNMLRFLAALVLISASAIAQELQWAELARRQELWPAQCSAKSEMKFDGGVVVRAGQKLTVLKISADEAQLQTLDGRTTFTAEPDEIDLLAVARTEYARLTPKQRALTYDTLLQQKDLWPLNLKLTQTIDFPGGKTVRQGEPLILLEAQPGKLLVKAEALKATFNVFPPSTDFMAQARKLVEDPNAAPRFVTAQQAADVQRQASADKSRADAEKARIAEEARRRVGPVIAELQPQLVSSVTGKAAPIDEKTLPRYIVFYRGSSTCPITRQFTPTLVRYYQQAKAANADFEIVYLMTEGLEDTSKFAKASGFSWRAIRYDDTGRVPSVQQHIGSLLPQLIVMDRNGRLLANGIQNAAPNALKQLDALLKAPPAR
jgi:hypothetical protein